MEKRNHLKAGTDLQKGKFLQFVKQCGFYKPYKDATNKIDFMRYCNNCLSYGYNVESETFYLCQSPILESVIIRIISEHQSWEELKEAFYIARREQQIFTY